MAKKKIDIELTEAQNVDEAMNYIFLGFKYFLKNHTYKTVLLIVGMFIGFIGFFGRYLTSDTINIIDDIKPKARPTGMVIQSNPFLLYAQDKSRQSVAEEFMIVFDGDYYGQQDANWEVRKLEGEDAILVYNKRTKRIKKLDDIPFSKLK